MTYDVIVVGGGHNGLAAGALLSKEGRKVLILEKRNLLGGVAAGEEFHPGHRTQGLLLDSSGLRPGLISELELESHGLRLREDEPPTFIPSPSGKGLLLHADAEKMQIGSALSEKDNKSYGEFRTFLSRTRSILKHILDNAPPPITDRGTDGLLTLLSAGLRLRALGRDDMIELLRIAPMCVGDWVKDWFEDERLRCAVAGAAVEGTFMGPWSAGTVTSYLIRNALTERSVQGGPQAVVAALNGAAKAAGAQIKTETGVARINVSKGRVLGVTTDKGDDIRADIVLSTADPKTTFHTLIAPTHIPDGLDEQIRNFRARGTTAKVNLALSAPLEFSQHPGERFERIRTGDVLDDIERAFDAVKYGEFSKSPHLDIKVSSIADPSAAPENKHTVEILVHFAPYDLEGGWTDAKRAELGDAVLAQLERYAPGVKKAVAHAEVLTPKDLESRYGLAQGHIYHGEPFLDQLYALRPSLDCAQYATPIEGLYLGGSGSHPGGGVTGAPGQLCAQAVLAAG